MISKKEILILGAVALGGVGIASMMADGSGGGGSGTRAGGIVGSRTSAGEGFGAGPSVYNLPAQGTVSFPKAPSFDLSKLLPSQPEPMRGAAGVSSDPKKTRVTPYLYTGGEVRSGAYSVASWGVPSVTPHLHTGGKVTSGAFTHAPWSSGGGGLTERGTAVKARVSSRQASTKKSTTTKRAPTSYRAVAGGGQRAV